MPYATVMVCVDADSAPEQRVRLAARVADKFNATLIGLSALAVRPAFVSEGVLAQDLMQTDINELRGRLSDRGLGSAPPRAPITASSSGGRCSTCRTGRLPPKRAAPISS
jgi:hypothetical protein